MVILLEKISQFELLELGEPQNHRPSKAPKVIPARSYGWMTHSWLASTEHHQIERERHEYTLWWLTQPHEPVELPVACTCRYKPYPHIGHSELSDLHNWRPR
jgi:hypothetical protein